MCGWCYFQKTSQIKNSGPKSLTPRSFTLKVKNTKKTLLSKQGALKILVLRIGIYKNPLKFKNNVSNICKIIAANQPIKKFNF